MSFRDVSLMSFQKKSRTFAVRLLGERLRILREPCVNSDVFGRALRFVNHGSAHEVRLLVEC